MTNQVKNTLNKCIGDYEIRKEIGTGQYGVVFLGVLKKTKDIVAIKCIKKQIMNDHALMRFGLEKTNLIKASDHPNLCQLFDFAFTENNFYLIMEFCNGGDLTKYLERYGKRLQVEVVQKFAAQIVQGLDIKPENLLLDNEGQNPEIKIADFGLSRKLEPWRMAQTICGTPLYSAPEVLLGQDYNNKADVWSLGAILYELLVGVEAFNANSIEEIKQMYMRKIQLN